MGSSFGPRTVSIRSIEIFIFVLFTAFGHIHTHREPGRTADDCNCCITKITKCDNISSAGTSLIQLSGWYFKGNDLGCADEANIDETACWVKCLNHLNCRVVAYSLSDTPKKCCFKGYGSYEVVQSTEWKLVTDRPFRSFQHQPNSHPGKRGASCETGIPCDGWNLVDGRTDAESCKTLCLLYPDCNVAIIHNKDGRCYLDQVNNWMESGYGPFDSWVL